MASRRSQRLLLNEWTEAMKKNQKRKSNTEELVLIDEDAETVVPSPPKKKSKKDKGIEKASPSKGKLVLQEQSGKEKAKQKAGSSKVQKSEKSDKGKQIQKADSDKGEKKKKISGKAHLSKDWFINFQSQGLWLDGYASTPIAHCSLICYSMIHGMKLKCIKRLKKTSIWHMLNPTQIAYPRLTRLFYLNLQQIPGKDLIITSRVAGIDIKLDHSVFAKVLGCSEKYNVDQYPDKKEGIKLAKLEFFLPNSASTSKQLTHSVLNVEAKVLFTILMRCVVPKENSKELLSDRVLYLMYLVMHRFDLDLPSIVMEHMLYSITKNRNHVLPYANLLPLFFEHFGIPVEDEEKITSGFGMINEVSLQRIGIVQTTERKWKFFSDLTPDEIKNKKFAKPKALTLPAPLTSTPPNQSHVLEKLDFIENELDELKQGQFELGIEFKKMHFLVSSLHDKTSQIFKTLNIVDVQETVPNQNESKDSGDTKELFDEHTTEEEEVTGDEKDESIDSDMPLGVAKKKKQKGKKVPVTVTSEDLFEDEDTQVQGEEQIAGTGMDTDNQDTEVVNEKQNEEAGDDDQEEEEVEEEVEEGMEEAAEDDDEDDADEDDAPKP